MLTISYSLPLLGSCHSHPTASPRWAGLVQTRWPTPKLPSPPILLLPCSCLLEPTIGLAFPISGGCTVVEGTRPCPSAPCKTFELALDPLAKNYILDFQFLSRRDRPVIQELRGFCLWPRVRSNADSLSAEPCREVRLLLARRLTSVPYALVSWWRGR